MSTVAKVFKSPEIARILNVSADSVRTAFKTGRLPGARIGTNWIATRSDLVAWLGEHRVAELFDPRPTPSADPEFQAPSRQKAA